MTQEQKANMQDAINAESTVVLIELDEFQLAALKYLDATEDRDTIARSAFASVLRGKVQSACDRAIKAKYQAESKGRKAVADECELEIQKLLKMKRTLEA